MFFDEIVLAITALLQAWTAKELRRVRIENREADQAARTYGRRRNRRKDDVPGEQR